MADSTTGMLHNHDLAESETPDKVRRAIEDFQAEQPDCSHWNRADCQIADTLLTSAARQLGQAQRTSCPYCEEPLQPAADQCSFCESMLAAPAEAVAWVLPQLAEFALRWKGARRCAGCSTLAPKGARKCPSCGVVRATQTKDEKHAQQDLREAQRIAEGRFVPQAPYRIDNASKSWVKEVSPDGTQRMTTRPAEAGATE